MDVLREEGNRISWEERSRRWGASLRGVLFKNFPEVLNEHIHRWHLRVILDFLELKRPESLLDVGCGYGRLSTAIREKFSHIEMVGLDISPHYVSLYQQHLQRPAFVAGVEQIPDTVGVFDCILAVTVLMYVAKDNLPKAVSQLMNHLRSGGTCIVIENHCSGKFFLNPFGLKDRFFSLKSTVDVFTGGRCFQQHEIKSLAQRAGGEMVRELRMPVTTLLIIPVYILMKILPMGFCRGLLKVISVLDKCLERSFLPSIHAAYLIRKT